MSVDTTLSWTAEANYTSEALPDWPSCAGCTLESSFIYWNRPPFISGESNIVPIFPVTVFQHLDVKINKCPPEGCFQDLDQDLPLHVVGTLEFLGLQTVYVYYSDESQTLYTLKTFSASLIGLSGTVNLTITDSKGFITTMDSIFTVIVVQDAERWWKSVREKGND